MHSSKPSVSPQITPDQTPESPPGAPKPSPKRILVRWLQLNTFGGRLFWMIMVGALTGVGGMAFLFSEMIKYQAEDQVRSTLDGQVNAIASVTTAAETLASGLGVSATTLHERQAQYADTYRELTLQLFERRPEFVTGLGLGQRENGILPDQSWLFPYYSVTPSVDGTDSDQSVRYEDFADDVGEFYPDSDRYRDYFVSQTAIWTEPYQQENSRLLTYYLPLFANDGRWLGTALVDVDGNYLSELLNKPVFRQMGSFTLLTRSGTVIADPANPDNNLKTYEDIPDLSALWQDVDLDGTGFLEGENGYWAYAVVPGQEWLVFGFVPYAAVFNRVGLITAGAAALVVALLSIATFLAVRSLNRRLRPVLNQCNQLAQTDSMLLSQWDQQDDLNQLSLAFFNMLEQLNLNEETIRRHEQKIKNETRHSDQVSEQFIGFTERLSQQAGKQQGLLRDVQELMAKVVTDSQSVDIQLDALNTLGRALAGELRRIPTHSAETLAVLEQQVDTLTHCVEAGITAESGEQLQMLAGQLAKNVIALKAHDRRWPSLDSLQQQTNNIAQAGQAAATSSQQVVDAVQSIAQLLAKIEQISTALLLRSEAISE
ncbi:MAG: Cache domain-containing protein [Cyanobacteria bacterium J06633_23]